MMMFIFSIQFTRRRGRKRRRKDIDKKTDKTAVKSIHYQPIT